MKELIRQRMEDQSDQQTFQFVLTCEICGREWKSEAVPFSKAEKRSAAGSKQIVYDTLYQREWQQALSDAIDEAVHHFNRCPTCHRLTCNHCFLICEDLDLCRSCAEQLQITGEPASFAGWMGSGESGS